MTTKIFQLKQDSTYMIDCQTLLFSAGISISGGRNSRTQPQVKIEKVIPGGAAEQEGTLKVSYILEKEFFFFLILSSLFVLDICTWISNTASFHQ